MLKVRLLTPTAKAPERAHADDAGLDLFADQEATLFAYETKMIKCGFSMALPEGFEAQVRSRSGLASKKGIMVLNSPGTIDSGYRGEVAVILHNTTSDRFEVKKGDKIAQMVVNQIELWTPVVVTTLDETDRGAKGFGSTGV